ncbi:hypothetical protein ACH4F6_22360 [Streptomyces sp. NPDC017936]|uniref:hypothetical protein n=1 Tax=Streptomyces sp. NPDC017936 TaxID=3365016 RepID=UPI00379917AD
MSKRRCVARGVPGGYRIGDNRGHRYWGDFCELCPDELPAELNGPADQARVVELMRKYKKAKR